MIQYISYSDLNEFYSIKEVCRLLEMDKENLRKSCEKYGVRPSRNETGDWGLTCHDLRRLHYFLYKAAGTEDDCPTIDSGAENRA